MTQESDLETSVKEWLSAHYWGGGHPEPYDLRRNLMVSWIVASNGGLSGVFLALEGSPPKGEAYVDFGQWTYYRLPVSVESVTFLARCKAKVFKASEYKCIRMFEDFVNSRRPEPLSDSIKEMYR